MSRIIRVIIQNSLYQNKNKEGVDKKERSGKYLISLFLTSSLFFSRKNAPKWSTTNVEIIFTTDYFFQYIYSCIIFYYNLFSTFHEIPGKAHRNEVGVLQKVYIFSKRIFQTICLWHNNFYIFYFLHRKLSTFPRGTKSTHRNEVRVLRESTHFSITNVSKNLFVTKKLFFMFYFFYF